MLFWDISRGHHVVGWRLVSSLKQSFSIPCTYIIVGGQDNIPTVHAKWPLEAVNTLLSHVCCSWSCQCYWSTSRSPYPVGDISTTPLTEFLPSPADCKVLLENYAVFLGHVIVKKLPFFIVFEDCVTHKHSEVMKQKSVIVSRFKLQIVNMVH